MQSAGLTNDTSSRFPRAACSADIRRNRHVAIDRIDDLILDILRREARISNSRLAERVNLSASAVYERVRRLERNRYILGYQARLCREKLGMKVIAFIEVKIERVSPDVMHRFQRAVSESPCILECHMVAGAFDYLLKVLVPDFRSCEEVGREIGELPGVKEVRMHGNTPSSERADLRENHSDCARPLIDDIDKRLLRLLQESGRLNGAQLAIEMRRSTHEVRERLSRLCRQGFIRDYVAVLNEGKLKTRLLVCAYASIRASRSPTGVSQALNLLASTCPEIVEWHAVAGNFDYLIKTRVPTLSRHQEIVTTRLWTVPGVHEIQTFACLAQVKNTERLPL